MEGWKLASPLLFKGSSAVSGLSTCILVMAFVTGCGSGTSMRAVPVSPVSNANWVLVGNTGQTGNLQLLFFTDSNGQESMLATSNDGSSGFQKSIDHGVTWTPLNTGSTSACHWGAGLNDIGEVISGTLHSGGSAPPSCVANDPHAMMRLVGNGNTWTMVPVQGNCCPNYFFLVAVGVTGSNTIAVGSGILAFSTDHGASWQAPTTTIPTVCGEKLGIATSPDSTVTVFADSVCGSAGQPNAPYYSKDGGKNWTAFPQAVPFGGGQDGNVWAAPNGQLITSWNGGFRTYTYGPQSPPNGTYSGAVSGLQAPHSLGGNGAGWVNTRHTNAIITSMGGATSTFSCGMYMSTTNGATWTQFNSGLPFTAGQPNNCGYASIETTAQDSAGFVYDLLNTGDIYRTTTPQ